MLEERLREIEEEIASYMLLKASNPSNGALESISRLRVKHAAFVESIELWHSLEKTYPNYDR